MTRINMKLPRDLAITIALLLVWGMASAQEDAEQEVVVTGIRASVEAAQEIKRAAPSVVEAITLQDLGKFTDTSISDALARVPGVNIEKNVLPQYGGGDGATIRGLGPTYGSTTLNGRETLGTPAFGGASGRQFDFGSVPPEILAGVTVFKTSTADRVEPGMAGQIDLQTLRPLDYSKRQSNQFFGSVSASGSRYSGDGRTGLRLSGVIGGRFLNDTLGVYVSALSSEDYFSAAQFLTYNGQYDIGVADAQGVVTPYENIWSTWGTDSWAAALKYQKTAIGGGVQWEPGGNLAVNFDFLSNRSDQLEEAQANYFQDGGILNLSSAAIAQPGAAIIGGATGGLLYYDTARISNIGTDQSLSYISAFHDTNENEFFATGLNVTWHSDDRRLRISTDLSHSNYSNFLDWRRPYAQNGDGGESTFDGAGEVPILGFTNSPATDLANPASYTNFGFNEFFQKQTTAGRNSARLDVAFEFNDNVSARAGIRGSQTYTKFISMNYDPLTAPTSLAGYFEDGTTNLPFFPVATPTVSWSGFCAANPAFCNQSNEGLGSFEGPFPTRTSISGGPGRDFVPATAGDVFGLNTSQSYYVKERNAAAYAQIDFQGNWFRDLRFAGNAGLRAVRIGETGIGFRGTHTRIGFTSAPNISSVVEPFEDTHAYWKYLPSLNLTVTPRDNLNLRLGAAQTMSLPSYLQLAPIGTVVLIQPIDGVGQPNQATTGNTRLKPTSALNYDVTAEYYMRYGGAVIASVFYKDVKDLITNVSQLNQTIPGQGATLFTVNSTINAATGHTSGFELGTHQPFSFLSSPWDGFGIQANYTYVDSKTTVPGGIQTPFVGSSKNNLNITGYYEKYGFAGRVAFLERSSYLTSLGSGNTYVRARSQLDASISQKLGDHFEVILTGSNLTDANRYQYSQDGGFVTGFFEQPRSFSLAFRANY